MLILYCIAVLTCLLLYYFYIPANSTNSDLNKYNLLFGDKFRQLKFTTVSGNNNGDDKSRDSLKKKLLKKLSTLRAAIYPCIKYLGLSVCEESCFLNNEQLRFESTCYSGRIEEDYK